MAAVSDGRFDDVPDGLPENDGERAAAVDAAWQILAGPTVAVERALLLQLMALLREATRLLERVLDEGSAQSVDDERATG
jgi:hypothetical protein